VSYEANVYRHVLQSLQVSVPRSYGTFLEPARGAPILVLEYLEPDEPGASLTLLEAEVVLAASWLASFHARAEDRIADEALRFLQVFDHGFYAGWIERTEQYARRLPHRLPWLPELCRRSLGLMERLGQTPLTVIHGEFYRKNILVRSSTVYPIDWDSAARGAAEVDLAALTEGWPEATRDEAEARYVRVRWPAGEPADFRSRLDAARLYFHYRWLGESRNAPAKRHWRMEQLRLTAERMGI
jgi:thiamine kinase-like enzyme